MIGALKYTIFTILCAVLLIVLALVLRLADQRFDSGGEWLRAIVDSENFGDRSLSFLVAALVTLGLLPWLTYTTYGLAALPWSCLKRRRRGITGITGSELTDDKGELQRLVQEEIGEIKENKRQIRRVHEMNRKPLSAKESSSMRQFNARLRFLQQKLMELKGDDSSSTSTTTGLIACCRALGNCLDSALLYPIRIIVGIALLIVVAVLMTSIIISQIDRTMHSKCGWTCGFAIANIRLWNPLDFCLTFASQWFPLDYALYTLILWLVLVATIVGLATLGIRFLCIHLYKIRFRSTVPQGMLTASVLLMSTVLIFSFWSVPSWAPQYSAFGAQHFVPNITSNATGNGTRTTTMIALKATTSLRTMFLQHLAIASNDGDSMGNAQNETLVPIWCNYDGIVVNDGTPSTNRTRNGTAQPHYNVIGRPCYASQVSTLMDRIALRAPYLSFIFYVANWAFVVLFVLYSLIAICRSPATCEKEADYDNENGDQMDEHDEQDAEEEANRILSSKRSRRNYSSSSRSRRRVASEDDYDEENL